MSYGQVQNLLILNQKLLENNGDTNLPVVEHQLNIAHLPWYKQHKGAAPLSFEALLTIPWFVPVVSRTKASDIKIESTTKFIATINRRYIMINDTDQPPGKSSTSTSDDAMYDWLLHRIAYGVVTGVYLHGFIVLPPISDAKYDNPLLTGYDEYRIATSILMTSGAESTQYVPRAGYGYLSSTDISGAYIDPWDNQVREGTMGEVQRDPAYLIPEVLKNVVVGTEKKVPKKTTTEKKKTTKKVTKKMPKKTTKKHANDVNADVDKTTNDAADTSEESSEESSEETPDEDHNSDYSWSDDYTVSDLENCCDDIEGMDDDHTYMLKIARKKPSSTKAAPKKNPKRTPKTPSEPLVETVEGSNEPTEVLPTVADPIAPVENVRDPTASLEVNMSSKDATTSSIISMLSKSSKKEIGTSTYTREPLVGYYPLVEFLGTKQYILSNNKTLLQAYLQMWLYKMHRFLDIPEWENVFRQPLSVNANYEIYNKDKLPYRRTTSLEPFKRMHKAIVVTKKVKSIEFDAVSYMRLRKLGYSLSDEDFPTRDRRWKVFTKLTALVNGWYMTLDKKFPVICEHYLARNKDGTFPFDKYVAKNNTLRASCRICGGDITDIMIDDIELVASTNLYDSEILAVINKLIAIRVVQTMLEPFDILKAISNRLSIVIAEELKKAGSMMRDRRPFIITACTCSFLRQLAMQANTKDFEFSDTQFSIFLKVHASADIAKNNLTLELAYENITAYWDKALKKYFSDPTDMMQKIISFIIVKPKKIDRINANNALMLQPLIECGFKVTTIDDVTEKLLESLPKEASIGKMKKGGKAKTAPKKEPKEKDKETSKDKATEKPKEKDKETSKEKDKETSKDKTTEKPKEKDKSAPKVEKVQPPEAPASGGGDRTEWLRYYIKLLISMKVNQKAEQPMSASFNIISTQKHTIPSIVEPEVMKIPAKQIYIGTEPLSHEDDESIRTAIKQAAAYLCPALSKEYYLDHHMVDGKCKECGITTDLTITDAYLKKYMKFFTTVWMKSTTLTTYKQHEQTLPTKWGATPIDNKTKTKFENLIQTITIPKKPTPDYIDQLISLAVLVRRAELIQPIREGNVGAITSLVNAFMVWTMNNKDKASWAATQVRILNSTALSD